MCRAELNPRENPAKRFRRSHYYQETKAWTKRNSAAFNEAVEKLMEIEKITYQQAKDKLLQTISSQ